MFITDSKNQSNGNKLRTYMIFKNVMKGKPICPGYLFVNELSKSEISTLAKLRISSHGIHIENGRLERPYHENMMLLCGMAVEDEKHFVMECYSFSTYRNIFFDDLEEIVPSFSSKNVGEGFSFIMECKGYDIACVCITNICIMHGARDTVIVLV